MFHSPPPTLDMQDWRASALNKLQVLVIHHEGLNFLFMNKQAAPERKH